MDPGVEGGFAAETADRFVGFGKNILEEIVRVLVIRGHVVDQPVKARGVFHHQLVERTGIAILRARDQLLVFIRSDRKSTRLNSSHRTISYAVFCLKKK